MSTGILIALSCVICLKHRLILSLVPDQRIYRSVRFAPFRNTDLSFCFRHACRSLLPSGLGSSKTLSGGCHLRAFGSWYGCIGRCLPNLLASTGGSMPSGSGKSNVFLVISDFHAQATYDCKNICSHTRFIGGR